MNRRLNVTVIALSTGKRELNKAANRLAILEAARAVFGDLGYEAATVRDIIRRTGLASGTFYNYYRSKEEVFEALADDAAARFRPILQLEFEAAPSFVAYIEGAVRAYFQFTAKEYERWEAKRPLNEPPPPMRLDTPEINAVFEEVRQSIHEVIERGDAPPVDVDFLAAACFALVRDIGEQMVRRRPIDVDGAAEFAIQMILGGVSALPTSKR
jgi:AcrR family transcriptional regulator